eukprot:TRINITY_DN24926_c0_g1_i2.p1 TRINITY_DN24926_c0_g1~~TRINITY_DN24926_c0_g1_i2.p1  ORF type:complete len:523 (+),score=79.21 TRINITY_DN24926_c0_g1_i2:78-1571(+)
MTCPEEDVPDFVWDHRLHQHWAKPEGWSRSRRGLWLALCRSVPLRCSLGYRGSPTVSCGADGKFSVKGSCELVGCGPPLKLSHSVPEISDEQALQGWTSGMRVSYKCDAGFKGQPFAECGTDGYWVFPHASPKCQLIGCGALEAYLQGTVTGDWWTNWRNFMNMTGEHDLKSGSHAGEMIHFTCMAGLRGRPVATCQAGGQWLVTDQCKPFKTSLGCRCRPKWVHCTGWLDTDCKEWYGCKPAGVDPYSWCEVEEGSCPWSSYGILGSEPTWDYCVQDNFGISWNPAHVPAKGIIHSFEDMYIAVIFFLAFAISCLCSRSLTQATVQFCKCGSELPEVLLTLRHGIARTPAVSRRMWRVVTWRCRVAWVRSFQAVRAAGRRLHEELTAALSGISNSISGAIDSCARARENVFSRVAQPSRPSQGSSEVRRVVTNVSESDLSWPLLAAASNNSLTVSESPVISEEAFSRDMSSRDLRETGCILSNASMDAARSVNSLA